MKTYLIARGKVEDRTHKKGIDSIISLDYMGASEYEWGALPTSLKAIRSRIDDYVYLNHKVNSKVEVTVFCHSEKFLDVVRYLELLSTGEMRTKNGHYFDWVCNGDIDRKVNFWWDIENHLMFWLTNIDFENKFKLLIPNTPE